MKKQKKQEKQIYLNIQEGDFIRTLSVSESQFEKEYADYEILEKYDEYSYLIQKK